MLNVPGLGEEGLTSGTMFDGIATKEASEVEEPMFHKLGVMEAMKKPGAATAAINWYRYEHSRQQLFQLHFHVCNSNEL